MYQRGYTTIAVSAGKPTKDKPKGGVYDRLDKLASHRKEPFGDIVERLLDFHDAHQQVK